MKTILLCTIGSVGDVNPYVGIGMELQRRGFGVVLITSQHFESQAREAGLDFIGLGRAEDYQRIIKNPDLWSPDQGFKVFAESVILPILEPAYQVIASFDPEKTVLVAQGQFFSAHIAHEKLGYPFITAHLQPAAFRSVHEFPLLTAWIPRLVKRGIFNLMDAFVLDKVFAPGINRFRPLYQLVFAISTICPSARFFQMRRHWCTMAELAPLPTPLPQVSPRSSAQWRMTSPTTPPVWLTWASA